MRTLCSSYTANEVSGIEEHNDQSYVWYDSKHFLFRKVFYTLNRKHGILFSMKTLCSSYKANEASGTEEHNDQSYVWYDSFFVSESFFCRTTKKIH